MATLRNFIFATFCATKGVVLTDLLLSHGLVVEVALVLATVSVYEAVQASTATGKVSKTKLLLTTEATICLRLLSTFIVRWKGLLPFSVFLCNTLNRGLCCPVSSVQCPHC